MWKLYKIPISVSKIKFHGNIAMITHSCVVAFVLKDRVK